MLVFDKWTCNTNGRQAIFFREGAAAEYSAQMIDKGFCFNAGEWNFPDAPLRGLYARHRVYESVRGLAAFGAWINRVENIDESVLEEIYSEIPPEWYAFEPGGHRTDAGTTAAAAQAGRRADCFGLEIVGAAVSQLEVNHAVDSKKTELKTLEPKSTLRYRILRYTPDLVRDEWVNIGVLLEETRGSRYALRLIEEPREIARIRSACIPTPMKTCCARCRLNSRPGCAGRIAKSPPIWKNSSRFFPMPCSSVRRKRCWPKDFDAELDRLYRDHVAPPSRRAGGILQCTRDWIREKLNDVFRRHRVLAKLEQRVRIEGFTQPGDPLRLDYGYQNGVRGFIHSISLRRDIPQAKVLAYTAERIHARDSRAQITAITEVEPAADNPRHQFVEKLFAEQNIRIVAMNRVESFAEELRLQLN